MGCFGGCGETAPAETTPATTEAPTVTENPEEAKTLKVLTLGHSLATNATKMLALVAKAEGYEDMVVGTLYYSGCTLKQHVGFQTNDSREYLLYVSSSATGDVPPEKIEDISMREAIVYDYWDIVIMQGGLFELAIPVSYTDGNIETIQNYVNEHKLNPNAVFGWHFPWVPATIPELQSESVGNKYVAYGNDRSKLFHAIGEQTGQYILTNDVFTCLIPSGAAVENAITSYLGEEDLLCDYAHATDLGRLIAAYTWYCVLAGVEQLETISLDAIPARFVATSIVAGDRILTEDDKALIVESVNNALKNPLTITQSQYQQEPAGYVPVKNQDG